MTLDAAAIWNTPVLGAYLLWNFTCGYCELKPRGPVLVLYFLAAAILNDPNMCAPVNGRMKNVLSYARAFRGRLKKKHVPGKPRPADVSAKGGVGRDMILTFPMLVEAMHQYTLDSLDVAFAKGLLKWNSVTNRVEPIEFKKKGAKLLSTGNLALATKAKALGRLFGKARNLQRIFSALEVTFV